MARRRAWRTARGLLVALVALTAALVGHAAAGGAVPLEALLVLAPLVALTGVAVADRELRLPVLIALVVGVQVVAHLAASLAPGHEHAAPSEAIGDRASGEQQPAEGERIRAGDPLEGGRPAAEIAPDRWQGDVEDRVVDHLDEEGERQCGHRDPGLAK